MPDCRSSTTAETLTAKPEIGDTVHAATEVYDHAKMHYVPSFVETYVAAHCEDGDDWIEVRFPGDDEVTAVEWHDLYTVSA